MKLIALYKAVTYRLLGSLSTFVISWFMTRSVKISLGISVLEFLGKIGLYYIHERIWDKITKNNN
jgi:uncharacterized membrane protein